MKARTLFVTSLFLGGLTCLPYLPSSPSAAWALTPYWPSDEVAGAMQGQGAEAARQGIGLSQAGVKLLPGEEQQELSALYAEALQTLSPEEKQRFLTVASKGQAASDREIAESNDLIQQALHTLSTKKIERLLALVGQAVQLQLTQAKSASLANK